MSILKIKQENMIEFQNKTGELPKYLSSTA
jgi:hypothetical protein